MPTSALSHFTQLRGSIKENIDLVLPPCLLVLGENYTYKTTILTNYRVALTGSPDPVISSRPAIGSTSTELLTLAANPQVGWEAVLMGPSGTATASLRVAGGQAKKPEPPVWDGSIATAVPRLDREKTLVYDVVGSIIAPRSKVAREQFLRTFGQDLKSIPQPEGFDDGQKALWSKALEASRLVAQQDGQTDTSAILAHMTAWARSAGLAATNQAKTLTTQAAGARERSSASPVSPERLAEYEGMLKQARAFAAVAPQRVEVTTLEGGISEAEVQLVDLRKGLKDVTQERDEYFTAAEKERQVAFTAREAADAARQTARDTWMRAKGVTQVIENTIKANSHTCPICTQEVPGGLNDLFQSCLARVEFRDRELKDAERLFLEAERALAVAGAKASPTGKDLYSRPNQIQSQITDLEGRVTRAKTKLVGLRTELKDAPSTAPAMTENDLVARIDAAKVIVDNRNAVDDYMRQSRQKERDAADCGVIGKEALRLQTVVMRQLRGEALQRINARMPNGLRADVEVLDTGLRWAVHTLKGRQSVSGSTSGAEWGALTAAMACVSSSVALRVLLMDDTDLGVFDKKNLIGFMTTVAEAVQAGELTQAIFAWNRPEEFAGVTVPGWQTIVRT